LGGLFYERISENVKWSVRYNFSEGKYAMPYSVFLGYEKGEDGNGNAKKPSGVRQAVQVFLLRRLSAARLELISARKSGIQPVSTAAQFINAKANSKRKKSAKPRI